MSCSHAVCLHTQAARPAAGRQSSDQHGLCMLAEAAALQEQLGQGQDKKLLAGTLPEQNEGQLRRSTRSAAQRAVNCATLQG